MRITVGGVLLLGGAVAVAVMGPLKSMIPSDLGNTPDMVKHSIAWVTSYFKGEQLETPPATPPATTAALPAAPTPQAPAAVQPPTAAKPQPQMPPVTQTQAVPPPAAPVVEKPAVTAKKSHRRRRHVPKLGEAPVSLALTKKPPKTAKQKTEASQEQDKLMGSYVALKLKTGREVKGILQGKTKTEYTLEIPGMGPFKYPVDNVVSVAPVE